MCVGRLDRWSDCILGAWKNSCCLSIDRSITPAPALASAPAPSSVFDSVLDSVQSMRLAGLARRVREFIHTISEDKKDEICGLLDFVMEKVLKYGDILPQAETLSKLRTGKVVRKETMRSRCTNGQARVLSSKHVNEGLKRLKEAEEERVK